MNNLVAMSLLIFGLFALLPITALAVDVEWGRLFRKMLRTIKNLPSDIREVWVDIFKGVQ